MADLATDSFRQQLGGFLWYTRVRQVIFCFYDTPVATRLSISMSGSTAFKRCILGAVAVRTITISRASDSGGWIVVALGMSHSFGRQELIFGQAGSFGFRKVIFSLDFWSGISDIFHIPFI